MFAPVLADDPTNQGFLFVPYHQLWPEALVVLAPQQLLRRHPGLVRVVRAAVQWNALPVRDEAAGAVA